jgi:hypothetical protein
VNNQRRSAPFRGDWFKSSHSNASGSCVETRFRMGATVVRDTKDHSIDSPVIEFSPDAWSCFLGDLASGRS